MGQTVVVAFLFFSGYGVMESITNKSNYMSNFLSNRVLKLLINFDIAVKLFLITQYILGRHISFKQYALALTTCGGIGNSNWYITCIICCYLFSYICARVTGKKTDKAAFLVLMGSLCLNYMLVLSKYRPWYCFDTILCYPLGMMFSVYKEKIIDCLKNNTNYAIAIVGGMSICIVSCLLSKSLIYRVIYEVSFCLVIVLATMHMKLKNSFLEYVGVNLFGLYILQRIPMMYFKQTVFFF